MAKARESTVISLDLSSNEVDFLVDMLRDYDGDDTELADEIATALENAE